MAVATEKQSSSHPAWIRQVVAQLTKTTVLGL
jgi:hypothetical protein